MTLFCSRFPLGLNSGRCTAADDTPNPAPTPRTRRSPLLPPKCPSESGPGAGSWETSWAGYGAGGAEEGARGPRAPLEPHWALNTAERFAAVSGGCSSEWKAAPQEDAAASGNRPAGARGSGASSSGFEHVLLPRYSTERRGRARGKVWGSRFGRARGARSSGLAVLLRGPGHEDTDRPSPPSCAVSGGRGGAPGRRPGPGD